MKPRPPKILMALDREFPPDVRVENEMESLLEKGFEVHLACYTRKARPVEDHWKNAGIFRKPISTFFYKSSVGALKFPFYFNFWRSFLDRLCRKNRYDAMHVHDLPLARVGWEMKMKYGMPLVLDLHENWPALLDIAEHTQGLLGKLLSSGRQWREYEKEYCRKADRVIVVVEEAQERLTKMGVSEDKIYVVPNTLNIINTEEPHKEPAEGEFIVFYGGGLNKHRGLQDIIGAMPHVLKQNPAVKLWIAGEGRYQRKLERLTRKFSLQNHVVFFGWKPFREMMELLRRAHTAIIPHIPSEHTDTTIPHKLFQYMYLRKPVIASACIPVRRILEETGAGLVYRQSESHEIARIILSLSENIHIAKEMAENGRKSVLEKYNWEKTVPALYRLYESLKIASP